MGRLYAIDLRQSPVAGEADNVHMIALMAGSSRSRNLRERVLDTLLEEHRSLRTVLALLEKLLHDVAELKSEPDFVLLSSALYYIDDFPERVHHPKEDEHIFARLRRRTAAHDAILDRLQAEHIRSSNLAGIVERALVHYQGGAPEGLERLRSAVSAYTAMLTDHMRTEEQLFESARDDLTDEDWFAIAAAFEADLDPLAADAARQEFRRLRARIMSMLPRKMRLTPGEIPDT
jgi:hemerythrin-like domain-containing protein